MNPHQNTPVGTDVHLSEFICSLGKMRNTIVDIPLANIGMEISHGFFEIELKDKNVILEGEMRERVSLYKENRVILEGKSQEKVVLHRENKAILEGKMVKIRKSSREEM